MADLYQLPDGRLIRRGTPFTLTETRKRVAPAIVGTADNGDQFIEKPAELVDVEESRLFPSNWLGAANGQELKARGITAIEEQPDPDTRYFMVSPGEVKDGVLTKHILPRPIEQLRKWMIDEARRQAGDLITQHYPLIEQTNDLAFRLGIADVAVPDSADDRELKLAKRRQAWIHDVKQYMRDLIADIEKLETAADAQAWHGTPADWPPFPEAKGTGKAVKPEVTAIK